MTSVFARVVLPGTASGLVTGEAIRVDGPVLAGVLSYPPRDRAES